MVKTLNVPVDDQDFYRMQEIKNRSGLSWDVFIIKAAEVYGNAIAEEE